jgi:four helix bundle protein
MIIYQKSLDVVRSVVRMSRIVAEQDADLARQMKRASMSVPLNIAEGQYSQGGNRVARFYNAMGSARETKACLDACVAAEYLTPEQVAVDLDRVDHVIGALWKLSRKRTA